MKKWTHQGQFLPFEPGTQFQKYRIEAVKIWTDRYFYLAETPQGRVVLAESFAFFQHDVLSAIHSVIQAQLAACEMDWLDYFQYDWQGLHLNYVVYPEWLWQALEQPLKEYLWLDGLPEDRNIQRLYQWMKSQQESLFKRGWCNPSLALPMMIVAPNGNWIQLEWEYCVPINPSNVLPLSPSKQDSGFVYPRFFVGYHERAYHQPLELVKTAIYATLIAALQGKSPKLWQFERVTWQSIRSLLTNPMRRFLESYLESDDIWPVMPAKIYSENMSRNDYVWAHQSFEKALDAYSKQHYQDALALSMTAAQTWLNDPWPYYLKAKIFEALGDKQQAIDALSQAWKHQKIACFARELADLLIHEGQYGFAQTLLTQALQQTPLDDQAWYLMGSLAQMNHYLEQAHQYYLQAYRLRPLELSYRQRLEQILNELGLEVNMPLLNAIGKKTNLNVCLQTQALPVIATKHWQRVELVSAKREHPSELWSATKSEQKALLKLFESPQDCHREFTYASQLKYPNFMSVIESENNYIVYEWISGTSLETMIRREPCQNDILKSISAQLSEAVYYLQSAKITHGDLSPGNMMWDFKPASLKVIDYDSLRLTGQSKKLPVFTQTSYAPLEFWQSHQTHQSTDSYSAGLSLLHLASGIFPDLCRDWKNRDFRRYRRYLSHLQDDWVERLLSNTHWDLARRTYMPLPELVLARSIPQHLKELHYALLSLSDCHDASQAPGLIQSLIQLEKSVITTYHASFHAHRLHLYGLSSEYAKECLRMDSLHLGAIWILADMKIQNNKPEDANKLLNQALQIDSQSPETWQMLLNVYRQSGNANLAFAACQHLNQILPNHLESKLQELALLADFHFDTQALSLIHRLLEQTIPDHVRHRLKGLQRDLLVRKRATLASVA